MLIYNILCLFLPKDGIYLLLALTTSFLLVTAMSNQRAVKIKGQKFTPCLNYLAVPAFIHPLRGLRWPWCKENLVCTRPRHSCKHPAQQMTRKQSVATGMFLGEKSGRSTPPKQGTSKYSFGMVMQQKLAASLVPYSVFPLCSNTVVIPPSSVRFRWVSSQYWRLAILIIITV